MSNASHLVPTSAASYSHDHIPPMKGLNWEIEKPKEACIHVCIWDWLVLEGPCEQCWHFSGLKIGWICLEHGFAINHMQNCNTWIKCWVSPWFHYWGSTFLKLHTAKILLMAKLQVGVTQDIQKEPFPITF